MKATPLAVTSKLPIPRPGTHEAAIPGDQTLPVPLQNEHRQMSAQDRRVATKGDLGQGDRLVSAKRYSSTLERSGLRAVMFVFPDVRQVKLADEDTTKHLEVVRRVSPTRDKDTLFSRKLGDLGLPDSHFITTTSHSSTRSAQHKNTPNKISKHPQTSPTTLEP
eukprot:Blabericola_migrator_1__10636@NODE_6059_length_610_cov_204_322284_g4043_i0_p1_GENE_NODE_6059_length_610_cov_204_322284_g4043_i0NODE_6059_length_610_cov_204_322284_g4043_i0_p1_ORF_typecomplete_len190_score20_46_NODE_6059_length_610_cov_204_322284_g4043_i080571